MTYEEREAEVAEKLLKFSNHEKTVACLRERLHTAWKALEMLRLDGESHPSTAELDKAVSIAEANNGELVENLRLYTEALHERARMQKHLSAMGHGAIFKN